MVVLFVAVVVSVMLVADIVDFEVACCSVLLLIASSLVAVVGVVDEQQQ